MTKPKYKPPPKPKRGHEPCKVKWMPWLYCCRCGLVYLRNEPTRAAIRQPCPAEDD
jgi:hypothetical protein